MALQTRTFSVGDLAWGSWSNAYLLELVITEESVDILENVSHVTYKLQFRSGRQNRFAEDVTSRLLMDGQELASDRAYEYLDFNSQWVLLSGVLEIPHDADGKKLLRLVGAATPDSGNKWAPPHMEVEAELELTPIPRASTLSAASGYIGQTIPLAVTKHSTDYTHSVSFSFGSESGFLDGNGNISQEEVRFSESLILFRLPMELLYQIPEAAQGVCNLCCTTYSGSQIIGTPQEASFSAMVDPDRYGLSIFGSVREGNPLAELATGGDILIPGVSRAICDYVVELPYGASIRELTVNGQGLATVDTLPVSDGAFLFRVVDSRGFWAEKLVQMPVVPYIPVTLRGSARRLSPTENQALLELSGSYYPGSLGAGENLLTLTCQVNQGRPITLTPQVEGENFSVSVTLPELDYRSSHTLVIEAADRLVQRSLTLTVNRGVPVFEWGEGDFTFHVPVTLPELNCPQLTRILERLAALENKN